MSGWRFTAKIPGEAGSIISACVFQDRLYLACQWGVYVLDDGKLIKIVTVAKPQSPQPKFGEAAWVGL